MDTSLIEYNAERNLIFDLQRIAYIALVVSILYIFIKGSAPIKVEPVVEEVTETTIDDRLNTIILEKAKLEKHYANEILNYIDSLGESIDALIEDVDTLKAKTRIRRR